MDNVLNEAVMYLESLGEDRCGTISLSFRRTDDCRRATIKANKSPTIYYHCQIGINRKDWEQEDGSYQRIKFFLGTSPNPIEAITDAFSQLKNFIANT